MVSKLLIEKIKEEKNISDRKLEEKEKELNVAKEEMKENINKYKVQYNNLINIIYNNNYVFLN